MSEDSQRWGAEILAGLLVGVVELRSSPMLVPSNLRSNRLTLKSLLRLL